VRKATKNRLCFPSLSATQQQQQQEQQQQQQQQQW
jgi:hypothetical protein